MPKLDLSNKENNANNVIIEIRMEATIAKPRFIISSLLSMMSRIKNGRTNEPPNSRNRSHAIV
jgi:hypothetical protein